MSQALQRRDIDLIVITDEQVELIRKTVAKDATPQELQLYFYDCQRRGVHPLDKLIHFTKRGGKYTPIVSIDYMRSQAAETGEYAGNDDAVFRGEPKAKDFAATVTVQRIVKGLLCSFTATARWSEYNPGSNKMYDSMPHTMLAKCAEALALRKGFPQQLSGLYTREEMEQAGEDITIRNVTPARQPQAKVLQLPPPESKPVTETAAPQSIHNDIKLLIQQLAAFGHSTFVAGADRQARIIGHIQAVAKDRKWEVEPLAIRSADELTQGELEDYKQVLTDELAAYKKTVKDDPLI